MVDIESDFNGVRVLFNLRQSRTSSLRQEILHRLRGSG
jgi:hypothetical protein